MKSSIGYLTVLLIIFAAGCAPAPTLQELEARAEITGNWSEVERYERMLARRAARQGPSCPTGKILYCEEKIGSERCACMRGDQMHVLLMPR